MQAPVKNFVVLFVCVWLSFTNLVIASRVAGTARDRRYNVLDYGAVGDGITLDTVAIKKQLMPLPKLARVQYIFQKIKFFDRSVQFNFTLYPLCRKKRYNIGICK